IQPGQRIGTLKVWRGSNIALESPLVAAETIETGSTTRRAIDGASELVIGLFRAGAEKL
ncbi:MAG TPA: D-alanyl-D-alanine carboxypeptidase, partial [Afipia sp.]|nr:D-alanyl-D-alanine carboxypeptidase [Afipia sp.]